MEALIARLRRLDGSKKAKLTEGINRAINANIIIFFFTGQHPLYVCLGKI